MPGGTNQAREQCRTVAGSGADLHNSHASRYVEKVEQAVHDVRPRGLRELRVVGREHVDPRGHISNGCFEVHLAIVLIPPTSAFGQSTDPFEQAGTPKPRSHAGGSLSPNAASTCYAAIVIGSYTTRYRVTSCSPLPTEPRSTRTTCAARSDVSSPQLAPDPREWTPRELRHSFVSLLSANGVRIEDISRLVGHSATGVSERVYSHQLRAVLDEGTPVMDDIFPLDDAGLVSHSA